MEKKIKVVFLNIYQKKVNRGGEVFVEELSQRLSKSFQVDVISDNKIPPARWPLLWRFYLDPQGLAIARFTLKNLKKLWQEKYNVVIPLNGGWQAALVRIITWLYGGKVLISGQSGIGWDDRNNLLCFPNIFVAVSTKAKLWASTANPFVKSVYVPNGVDLQKFTPTGKRYPTNLGKPIILSVGALVPEKNLDLTIKAVAKLSTGSLLLVGSGPLKNKIRKLGEKLLGDRFALISVPHNEMPRIYRAGDVFTLVPFHSEAFGIVFAEALAANLPVVTIDDDQRREIIGNAGVHIANFQSPENYARAIKYVLNRDWGDKPRRRAEKFDWSKIAEEYKKLILELT